MKSMTLVFFFVLFSCISYGKFLMWLMSNLGHCNSFSGFSLNALRKTSYVARLRIESANWNILRHFPSTRDWKYLNILFESDLFFWNQLEYVMEHGWKLQMLITFCMRLAGARSLFTFQTRFVWILHVYSLRYSWILTYGLCLEYSGISMASRLRIWG